MGLEYGCNTTPSPKHVTKGHLRCKFLTADGGCLFDDFHAYPDRHEQSLSDVNRQYHEFFSLLPVDSAASLPKSMYEGSELPKCDKEGKTHRAQLLGIMEAITFNGTMDYYLSLKYLLQEGRNEGFSSNFIDYFPLIEKVIQGLRQEQQSYNTKKLD